jgi:hypothetical protein
MDIPIMKHNEVSPRAIIFYYGGDTSLDQSSSIVGDVSLPLRIAKKAYQYQW